MLDLVKEAVAGGARKARAGELLGVPLRTVGRWQRCGLEDRRPQAVRPRPANALSAEERERVLALLCSPEYRDLSPRQVVPRLADAGTYLASESTIYSLLREAKLLRHRERSRPATPRKPGGHDAVSANRVWSWDISYLPAQVRGIFFYLYLVEDLYSRKVIGWQVHDHESSECAPHRGLPGGRGVPEPARAARRQRPADEGQDAALHPAAPGRRALAQPPRRVR